MKIIGFYYNERLELSKKQIKKLEKQLYRFGIVAVAVTLNYAKRVNANPFDPIGWEFWGYVKGFSFFACLIMCGIEVIKSLGAGDHKAILKIILKYAIAYGSFSMMPWLFVKIDTWFQVMK